MKFLICLLFGMFLFTSCDSTSQTTNNNPSVVDTLGTITIYSNRDWLLTGSNGINETHGGEYSFPVFQPGDTFRTCILGDCEHSRLTIYTSWGDTVDLNLMQCDNDSWSTWCRNMCRSIECEYGGPWIIVPDTL